MVVTRLPSIDTEEPANSRLKALLVAGPPLTAVAQVGI